MRIERAVTVSAAHIRFENFDAVTAVRLTLQISIAFGYVENYILLLTLLKIVLKDNYLTNHTFKLIDYCCD
jgi:hypothetical protein